MTNKTLHSEEWSPDKWNELFKHLIRDRTIDGEDLDDILFGAWILGRRRAKIMGNNFVPYIDVVQPLGLFCWWPLKPEVSDNTIARLQDFRINLFENLKNIDYEIATEILNDAVPNEALKLNIQQLDENRLLELLRC